MLDPDPDSMNPDPKHCPRLFLGFRACCKQLYLYSHTVTFCRSLFWSNTARGSATIEVWREEEEEETTTIQSRKGGTPNA
jgi:hypothetical protein